EWMDPLEGSMVAGKELADRRPVARSRAESVDPISDQGGDLSVVGRLHSPTEGVDGVPAPVPGPLVVVGVRVARGPPYRRQDKAMGVSNLGEGHEPAARPTALARSLVIDPASRGRIPRDLKVVLQLLAADGLALVQQRLDLPSYQRVAFKGC